MIRTEGRVLRTECCAILVACQARTYGSVQSVRSDRSVGSGGYNQFMRYRALTAEDRMMFCGVLNMLRTQN